MSTHTHGGNVYQYADCTDFSANCNPLGTPESVIQEGIRSLQRVYEYPQVGYQPLRDAIAAYEQIKSSHVICGNGAAELIFSLCHAIKPKQALVLAPTFAEYQQALESEGCEIQYYTLKEENSFSVKEDFLEALTPELDLVFLCNPNNPTGMLTEKAFLHRILQRCREYHIFLVIDECFQDFIEQPLSYTMKTELEEQENLFLLKAFTKRYAMAGIRLGYGLSSNQNLLTRMEQCVQPWNISTIAQACGLAALNEQEYVEKSRQLIFKERAFLKEEMRQLGLKVYDSQANYLFFQGSEELFEQCLKKKLLIRDCSNYEGLKKGYYRIAVKLHADNEKLIRALQEILKDPETE